MPNESATDFLLSEQLLSDLLQLSQAQAVTDVFILAALLVAVGLLVALVFTAQLNRAD